MGRGDAVLRARGRRGWLPRSWCGTAAELEVKVRLGEPELVKEAGSRALGLRVLRDHRVAVTYSSDFAPASMRQFARESVELCELAEPDPLADLPARHEMAREVPDLDLWDETAPSFDAAQALRLARQGEQAALQCDRRVTNSEGAVVARVMGATAFASSAGFSGGYRGTNLSLVVAPVCDDADGKKRNGHYWTASRFASGLLDAEAVGLEAARRTLAKLGSRKIATCQVPAVFAPEAARALLGQLAAVVSGGAVWRKSSYLAAREGTAVASPLVTVVDDPLRRRAPGSRPFDGEGLAARPNVVVSEGVLRTFLCDVYSARKLGRRSTGSAGAWRRRRAACEHVELRLARGQDAAGRAGTPGPGTLRHRSHGLRLQPRDRRLVARRERLLDRQRQPRPSGQRDHHLDQLRRSVEEHRWRGRRPRHAQLGAKPEPASVVHHRGGDVAASSTIFRYRSQFFSISALWRRRSPPTRKMTSLP